MSIVFKRVTYKNIKSVGNQEIVIELNKSKTTLISGINGTGKTTMITALCFGLFGRDYGSVTKQQLINSINQKQCLVTVEFEIGRKKFKVVRGIKPNIFEIYENGKLRKKSADVRDDQKILEQQILKMNYRAFTQVVVMGSGYYVPFMRLPTWQRREFIEDLLDIRIFSVMYRILFEQMKKTKEDLSLIALDLKSTKEKIKMQENFIEKITKERQDDLQERTKEVQALTDKNDQCLQQMNAALVEVAKLNKEYEEYEGYQEKFTDIRQTQKLLQQKISEAETQKEFYHDAEVCPTCQQDIGASHRKHLIQDMDETISRFETDVSSIQESLDVIKQQLAKGEEILDQIATNQNEVSNLNRLITTNTAIIESKKTKSVQTTDILPGEKAKLKEFAKEILKLDKQKRALLDLQQYQDLSSVMLLDTGIKSKIIKQYIPTINKLINKYLGALDFFVSFNLDENFNESVKSRHRDEFCYDSFSEGQKLRIDLALTFCWREVAKMKNSVNTNLLFMDEILDGSLDQAGVDLFMTLLEKVNIDNIFIISHKDIGDKFDDHIKFSIKNNFTMKE